MLESVIFCIKMDRHGVFPLMPNIRQMFFYSFPDGPLRFDYVDNIFAYLAVQTVYYVCRFAMITWIQWFCLHFCRFLATDNKSADKTILHIFTQIFHIFFSCKWQMGRGDSEHPTTVGLGSFEDLRRFKIWFIFQSCRTLHCPFYSHQPL